MELLIGFFAMLGRFWQVSLAMSLQTIFANSLPECAADL
jgi:hypothetical protein